MMQRKQFTCDGGERLLPKLPPSVKTEIEARLEHVPRRFVGERRWTEYQAAAAKIELKALRAGYPRLRRTGGAA